MKNWVIISNYYTGEPTGQLVCGECFESKFEWFEGEEIKDHTYHFSDNCSTCGKSCGDYFAHHRKAA
jgi:hypothetical protein